MDDFQVQFKRTHFALCQVLEVDAKDKIHIGLIMMVM